MINKGLITCIVILMGFIAKATEESYSIRENANRFSTSTGFDITLEDGRYSELLNSPNFVDKEKTLYIKFGIDERVNYGFISGFTQLSVDVEITPVDNQGIDEPSFTRTLTLSYSPDGLSGAVNIRSNTLRHSGSHKYKIHVGATNIAVPANIYIDAELRIDRYYEISQNAPLWGTNTITYTPTETPLVINNGGPIPAGVNEIEVWWDYVLGAEEYELEWTWVDNYNDGGVQTTILASAMNLTEREFELNHTSIVTNNQSFRIPLIYARGFLVYRVRGVGRWIDNGFLDVDQNKYGEWTASGPGLTNVINWPHLIIETPHEEVKNWQFQAVYAEEGKKKEIISYFDGSLRNRQTVTKVNSNNEAIVGESIYDNQGRAAVQVLPSPVSNPALKYYPTLNLNGSGTPFSHSDFDWDDPSVNQCSSVAGAMSTASGASKYYSSNNAVENNWQDQVPDAAGFPYTQTEYTPDNTGRIRTQSGVGANYAVDGDHATKYYYLQPNQAELNRLFGYEVGYVSRYKKNLVIDANGQVSISYLDPQGRVIATALAGTNSISGTSQTSTNLRSLNSEMANNHFRVTADLLNKDNINEEDIHDDNNKLYNSGNIGAYNDGLKVNTQIASTGDDIAEFNYRIRTSAFADGCFPGSFPFAYSLNLNIQDDCGESLIGITEKIDNTGTTTFNDLNGGLISENYNTENLDLVYNFSSDFKAGAYALTKRLEVDPVLLDQYTTDYIENNTCLLPPTAFFENNVNCEPDIVDPSLNIPDPTSGTTCFSSRRMMMNDLSPNGQYGATNETDALSIFTDDNYLQQGNLNLDYTQTVPTPLNWRTPATAYIGDNGQVSTIIITETNNTYSPDVIPSAVLVATSNPNEFLVKPEELTNLSDFLLNWEANWAASLLAYHPEYYYFEHMELICNQTYNTGAGGVLSSDGYNGVLQGILSFDDAYSGSNAFAFNLLSDNIRNNDPFFNINYASFDINSNLNATHDFKTAMMTEIMADYKQSLNGGTVVSLLEHCIKIAACGNNLSGNCVAPSLNTFASTYTTTQKDLAWSLFKQLYIAEKKRINQLFLEVYTLTRGCYNGYIGNGVPSTPSMVPFTYYQNPDLITNADFMTILGGGNDQNVTSGGFPLVTDILSCSELYYDAILANQTLLGSLGLPGANSPFPWAAGQNAHLFENKLQRFIPMDYLYDSSLPEDVMLIETAAKIDAEIYANTGRCDLSFDLEYFLDEMAQNGHLITNGISSDQVMAFTSDLYAGLGGNINGTPIIIQSTVIGGNLNITASNAAFGINLDNLNANNFSDILSFSDLYYIPGTNYQFEVLVTVQTANGIEERVVSGTTEMQIGNCNYSDFCERPDILADNLGIIFSELTALNYTSSAPNIYTLQSVISAWYEGSELQEQLGDFVPIGTTVGMVNVSNPSTGNFEITLGNQSVFWNFAVPPVGLISISGYNYFDNFGQDMVRIYYIDNNGDLQEATAAIGYVVEHITTPFELECDCKHKSGFADKFKLAINDLLDEFYYGDIPNHVEDGYSSQYLEDILRYLTVSDATVTNFQFQVANTTFLQFDLGIGADICTIVIHLGASNMDLVEILNVDFNVDSDGTLTGVEIIGWRSSEVIVNIIQESLGCIRILDCDPCIPSTVGPKSCHSQWQVYNAAIATLNSSLDDIDQFPVYTVEEFCQTNLAYVVEPYLEYISQSVFNITDNNDPNYISIGQFSNTQLNVATEIEQVTAYHNYTTTVVNWNNYIDQIYLPNNTVCPPNLKVRTLTTEIEFPCEPLTAYADTVNAANQYAIYIQNAITDFRKRYTTQALTSVIENFDHTYSDKEYHYTLYYYDQAGNLIQTVPPEGVDRIDASMVKTDITTARKNNSSPVNTSQSVKNVLPEHAYKTQYEYNSLNQLIWQVTPDGGESNFAYDDLGRLVLSQNAKQKLDYTASYTVYDPLGRIVEVGELTLDASTYTFDGGLFYKAGVKETLSDIPGAGGAAVNFPSNITALASREVTRTLYDELTLSNIVSEFEAYSGGNTRNRIVGVLYFDTYANGQTNYASGTFYDYDVHGNVKELIQDNQDIDLVTMGQNLKKTKYDYDLVSGNVKEVAYQNNEEDQFIHRYCYDADNRITITETSKDKVNWEKDAKYFYYDHGPLARTEIGDQKVQALDYAYTIQGWLKGVNSENLLASTDQGQDALNGNINQMNAKDVMGYSLHYFDGDYKGRQGVGFLTNSYDPSTNMPYNAQANTDLFNGNIKEMYTAGTKTNGNALKTSHTWYQYDQLNRIRFMNQEELAANETPAYTLNGYGSTYTYDDNGNLKTLTRKTPTDPIDQFAYHYYDDGLVDGDDDLNIALKTNRLSYVKDALGSVIGDDLANQASENYWYDAIGQLKRDAQEEIDKIEWTVTGKVRRIKRLNTSTKKDLEFHYDAMGNRTMKIVIDKDNAGEETIESKTVYIRDVQGNAMSTYKLDFNDPNGTIPVQNNLYLSERNIYGSNRIGMEQVNQIIASSHLGNVNINDENGIYSGFTDHYVQTIGDKRYELANHLGNVLQVITDRRLAYLTPVQISILTTITDQVGISVTGNIIQKVAGTAWGNAGGASIEQINGDGGLKWTLSSTSVDNDYVMVGLSSVNTDANYNTIEYAWYVHPSSDIMIYESGTSQGTIAPYGSASVLEIKRTGSTLEYLLDGVVMRTVTGVSTTNLIADFAMRKINSKIVQLELTSEVIELVQSADIVSQSDYYPFGMMLPNRYETTLNGEYRYGFQGQEMDDEIKGVKGSSVNYKYRMHDPRVGRFFAVDPLSNEYPVYSPYSFSGNRVIDAIEIEGLEPGVLFDSKNAAAENWAMYYGGEAFIREKEYASALLKVEENGEVKYKYTKAVEGGRNAVKIPDEVKDGNSDGIIHNHPYFPPTASELKMAEKAKAEGFEVDVDKLKYSEEFSGTHGKLEEDKNGLISDDISIGEKYDIPVYLLTPTGKLKEYNPTIDKSTIIETTNPLPSDSDSPKSRISKYIVWDASYDENTLKSLGGGVDLQRIYDYNGIVDINELKDGQFIKIPHSNPKINQRHKESTDRTTPSF